MPKKQQPECTIESEGLSLFVVFDGVGSPSEASQARHRPGVGVRGAGLRGVRRRL
jgi:hypothetical protein